MGPQILLCCSWARMQRKHHSNSETLGRLPICCSWARMQRNHHSNGETLRRLPNIHHLSSPPRFLHVATLTHPFSPLLPSAPSQLTHLNPLPPRPAAPPPSRPPSSHRLNLPPLHRCIHGRTRPAGSAPASGRPRAATPRAPPTSAFWTPMSCALLHGLTTISRQICALSSPRDPPSSDPRHRRWLTARSTRRRRWRSHRCWAPHLGAPTPAPVRGASPGPHCCLTSLLRRRCRRRLISLRHSQG
jgi:hypothetical protein